MRLRVHPTVNHLRAMLGSTEKRTGKSLHDWASIVQELGERDVNAAAAKLKAEYGLGKPTAWMLASHALKANMEDYDEAAYLAKAPHLVDAQFDDKRAHLRPLAETIIGFAEGLGEDVASSPCKTYIPLYRQRVFAQVKAATQKRLDVGLALGGYSGDGQDALKDTGGAKKGDRITHAICLSAEDGITEDVKHWLQIAYELDE
ncbi:MAG: DUF4287 domain-containing protein [Kordiimonadaceae bacterium]|nr:DUF4287 domain-containing protein [Kordiimonadaceae bacterium]MBO6570295.1 DUF4287 domain-containing protein [Kordiimonadaceae bacterium]MBO6965607.1 DUF4287 domain-containing protein [Kordiimonadaceae bacterium]